MSDSPPPPAVPVQLWKGRKTPSTLYGHGFGGEVGRVLARAVAELKDVGLTVNGCIYSPKEGRIALLLHTDKDIELLC